MLATNESLRWTESKQGGWLLSKTTLAQPSDDCLYLTAQLGVEAHGKQCDPCARLNAIKAQLEHPQRASPGLTPHYNGAMPDGQKELLVLTGWVASAYGVSRHDAEVEACRMRDAGKGFAPSITYELVPLEGWEARFTTLVRARERFAKTAKALAAAG